MKTSIAMMSVTAAIAAGAGSASASVNMYGADSSLTSTVMHGGDRELTSLGFTGASAGYTGANFTQWVDGVLNNYTGGVATGPFGWANPTLRDMAPGQNQISGNPDRADNSTPFTAEASNKGTLSEVFGTSRLGYKNMSWIIDGEESCDVEVFTLDLFFASGKHLDSDANTKTPEVAILERGMNSDVNVYGIKADHSLTGPIFVGRDKFGYAGWKLNTLEIDEDQKVGGVGISLDDSWDGLIGLRLEMKAGFDGPDIVAVGTSSAVPVPGAGVVMGVTGLLAARRRRR